MQFCQLYNRFAPRSLLICRWGVSPCPLRLSQVLLTLRKARTSHPTSFRKNTNCRIAATFLIPSSYREDTEGRARKISVVPAEHWLPDVFPKVWTNPGNFQWGCQKQDILQEVSDSNQNGPDRYLSSMGHWHSVSGFCRPFSGWRTADTARDFPRPKQSPACELKVTSASATLSGKDRSFVVTATSAAVNRWCDLFRLCFCPFLFHHTPWLCDCPSSPS